VDEPTLALAAIAGMMSFISPCMLPVIPAFFAQLAGTSLGCKDVRRRDVFAGALMFVAGFSMVFLAAAQPASALPLLAYALGLGTPFLLNLTVAPTRKYRRRDCEEHPTVSANLAPFRAAQLGRASY